MRFLLGLIIGMIIGIIFMERQVCINDGLAYDWDYGTCKKGERVKKKLFGGGENE